MKCYLPGVPRATYLPYPFQIVQEPNTMLLTYEFAGADRIVYMNGPNTEAQVDSWMGYNARSLGRRHAGDRRERSTTETWLDSAGNFHGGVHAGAGALHAHRRRTC